MLKWHLVKTSYFVPLSGHVVLGQNVRSPPKTHFKLWVTFICLLRTFSIFTYLRVLSFRKGLNLSLGSLVNPFSNKPWFLRVCCKSLSKKTVGKGETARNERFHPPISHSVFYPFGELSANFIENCRLQTLSRPWNAVKDHGLIRRKK